MLSGTPGGSTRGHLPPTWGVSRGGRVSLRIAPIAAKACMGALVKNTHVFPGGVSDRACVAWITAGAMHPVITVLRAYGRAPTRPWRSHQHLVYRHSIAPALPQTRQTLPTAASAD